MMPTITLDREVLYREVWERPISKVAKDYGLSDVGLAKACTRLRVPTPPRGYWARLEAGQSPRIPPLPPTKGRVCEEIDVRTREPAPNVDLIPEPTIVVADNLRGMHPLIRATQGELSGARASAMILPCCREEFPVHRGKIPCSSSQGIRVYQCGITDEFRRIQDRYGPNPSKFPVFSRRSGNSVQRRVREGLPPPPFSLGTSRSLPLATDRCEENPGFRGVSISRSDGRQTAIGSRCAASGRSSSAVVERSICPPGANAVRCVGAMRGLALGEVSMSTVQISHPRPSVSVITLDRPDRLNAISFEMVADLHDALDAVASDRDCNVAILTGAGRGFCAGLDLKDYGTPPEPGSHRHFHSGMDAQTFMSNLTVHMRDTPQILIAAVNGPAFGGGLALACAADIRIAAPTARFCSAFIRTGLSGTDIGITYLLPRLLGNAHAFDLILTGRDIDAVEAHRIGLVSEVAESDVMTLALEYAERLCGYTRVGLLSTKNVLWQNAGAASLEAALALEIRNQNLLQHSAEVTRFMAKYSARTAGPKR